MFFKTLRPRFTDLKGRLTTSTSRAQVEMLEKVSNIVQDWPSAVVRYNGGAFGHL